MPPGLNAPSRLISHKIINQTRLTLVIGRAWRYKVDEYLTLLTSHPTADSRFPDKVARSGVQKRGTTGSTPPFQPPPPTLSTPHPTTWQCGVVGVRVGEASHPGPVKPDDEEDLPPPLVEPDEEDDTWPPTGESLQFAPTQPREQATPSNTPGPDQLMGVVR